MGWGGLAGSHKGCPLHPPPGPREGADAEARGGLQGLPTHRLMVSGMSVWEVGGCSKALSRGFPVPGQRSWVTARGRACLCWAGLRRALQALGPWTELRGSRKSPRAGNPGVACVCWLSIRRSSVLTCGAPRGAEAERRRKEPAAAPGPGREEGAEALLPSLPEETDGGGSVLPRFPERDSDSCLLSPTPPPALPSPPPAGDQRSQGPPAPPGARRAEELGDSRQDPHPRPGQGEGETACPQSSLTLQSQPSLAPCWHHLPTPRW